MIREDVPLLQQIKEGNVGPISTKWAIVIVIGVIVILIALFVTAPRDATVHYNEHSTQTFQITPQVYLNLTERYTIENPNYTSMNADWVHVAAYYGAYTLGDWVLQDVPVKISILDDKEIEVPMQMNLPTVVSNAMSADCQSAGNIKIRFDGFIAISYLWYDHLWRLKYERTIACPF